MSILLDPPNKKKRGLLPPKWEYRPLTKEQALALPASHRLFVGSSVSDSGTPHCAGAACRTLTNLFTDSGRPDLSPYALAENKNFPRELTEQGVYTSWLAPHTILNTLGGNSYYSRKDTPVLDNQVWNTAPVGSFVLLGDGWERPHATYAEKAGHIPSRHTVTYYGLTADTKEPIFIDSYNRQAYVGEKDLRRAWPDYSINSVLAPKEFETFQTTRTEPDILTPLKDLNLGKYLQRLPSVLKAYDIPGSQRDLGKFLNTLQKHSGELSSYLKLSPEDYEKLATVALGLTLTESQGGMGLRGLRGLADRAFGSTQGYTQLSLKNIAPEHHWFLSQYGINKSSDLSNPEKSALATLVHLADLHKNGTAMYAKGVAPQILPGTPVGFKGNLRRLQRGLLPTLHTSDHPTEGNSPLTETQLLGYRWRGDRAIRYGNAQGEDQYVKNLQNYVTALRSTWVDPFYTEPKTLGTPPATPQRRIEMSAAQLRNFLKLSQATTPTFDNTVSSTMRFKNPALQEFLMNFAKTLK
jgi:hypothetical protein